MKKLFVLLVLLLIAFLVVNRNRVYLRDPLAKVTRMGQVVSGVKVFMNYSNDVLLDDSGLHSQRRLLLVQHWNQTLETPTAPLKCIDAMACLLDADRASGAEITSRSAASPESGAMVSMTNRVVQFIDADGVRVKVKLR